ncbi:hypothetical protein BG004_001920 [Podila humilis]|nr:hypothetical protein BG004_001920 [Podila humilis]
MLKTTSKNSKKAKRGATELVGTRRLRTRPVDQQPPQGQAEHHTQPHPHTPQQHEHYKDIFLIPELVAKVAFYLAVWDLASMTATCRKWHSTCTPLLYRTLFLTGCDPSKEATPDFVKHGHNVRNLSLSFTPYERIWQLLSQLNHLRSLDLTYVRLSRTQLENIIALTAVTAATNISHVERPGLEHFGILLEPSLFGNIMRNTDGGGGRESLSELLPKYLYKSLESLSWGGNLSTAVSLKDLALVLEGCPRLVSLKLSSISVEEYPVLEPQQRVVVVNEDNGDDVVSAAEQRPESPLIIDSSPRGSDNYNHDHDKHFLKDEIQDHGQRRLRKLTLVRVNITDQGLLQLLGIDLKRHQRLSGRKRHALTHLEISVCKSLTFRSARRILQECGSLETLNLEHCWMASLELFEDDEDTAEAFGVNGGNGGVAATTTTTTTMTTAVEWACTSSLKRVYLDIRSPEWNDVVHSYCPDATVARLLAFTIHEQLSVWKRLSALKCLQHLKLTGYPIDYPTVADMSFAQQLETAEVKLPVRVGIHEIDRKKPEIVAKAERWVASQPSGWSSTFFIDKFKRNLPTAMLTFKR